MEYKELENLYNFSADNDLSISKHEVKIPSKETVEMLVENYEITLTNINKRIQVLDNMKDVSFVLSIGNLTLFETVCRVSDEYTVDPYKNNEIY